MTLWRPARSGESDADLAPTRWARSAARSSWPVLVQARVEARDPALPEPNGVHVLASRSGNVKRPVKRQSNVRFN